MEQAMTDTVSLTAGGHERVAYTIEHRGRCILITGEVPMLAFGTLTMLAPKDAVMDPDAARMLGVTFAMGPTEELAALKASRAEATIQHNRLAFPQLSEGAQKWLATGERGASSESLFSRCSGMNIRPGKPRYDHPHDVADFRRCRLLLEACPEFDLSYAAGMSPQWAYLAAVWGTICDTMDEEAPDWRSSRGNSCPKTYSLIKTAIKP
jgi:hypothetical protein